MKGPSLEDSSREDSSMEGSSTEDSSMAILYVCPTARGRPNAAVGRHTPPYRSVQRGPWYQGRAADSYPIRHSRPLPMSG